MAAQTAVVPAAVPATVPATDATHRDRLVDAAITVGAGVAFAASLTTLAELARAAGWTAWHGWLAYAFPGSIDVIAIAAVRVWLSKRYSDRARLYARRVAMATVVGSIAGNAVQHLVAAGYLSTAGWLGVGLVIVVGAVPPAALAAAVHLRSLIGEPVPSPRHRRRSASSPGPSRPRSAETVPADAADSSRVSSPSRGSSRPAASSRSKRKVSSPVPSPAPSPSRASGSSPVSSRDELSDLDLQRIRRLDAKHREEQGEPLIPKVRQLDADHEAEHGRPLSRDALRRELGVRNEDAGLLLRAARAQQEEVA